MSEGRVMVTSSCGAREVLISYCDAPTKSDYLQVSERIPEGHKWILIIDQDHFGSPGGNLAIDDEVDTCLFKVYSLHAGQLPESALASLKCYVRTNIRGRTLVNVPESDMDTRFVLELHGASPIQTVGVINTRDFYARLEKETTDVLVNSKIKFGNHQLFW